jgi:hypothetical protein
MPPLYSWIWMEEQVAKTVAVWNNPGALPSQGVPAYTPDEQNRRERAYDDALQAVERSVKSAPLTRADRLKMQGRVMAAFTRFSATALGLHADATALLTNDFLPAGTQFVRWARRFDAGLSMPDIIQGCRNAWTACGLQPLLGMPVAITPSILGYSMIYPYSDNFLDEQGVSQNLKLGFSRRFRRRLSGEKLPVADSRETALWALVELIESQYPRQQFPQVFDCLLAIHRAQEESIRQLGDPRGDEVLKISCAKGGSSVLADACLAQCWLSEEENRFAFEWGVLLQLGDDLQDVHEDLKRNSVTLFSRAAADGEPLDGLALQLLNFGDNVGKRMDCLPNGSKALKELLKMSWRSLIIRAVADSHQFFSSRFIRRAEQWSPFRFEFLRARQGRLTSKQGLYSMLFDAFLESPEGEEDPLNTFLAVSAPKTGSTESVMRPICFSTEA